MINFLSPTLSFVFYDFSDKWLFLCKKKSSSITTAPHFGGFTLPRTCVRSISNVAMPTNINHMINGSDTMQICWPSTLNHFDGWNFSVMLNMLLRTNNKFSLRYGYLEKKKNYDLLLQGWRLKKKFQVIKFCFIF